jgi:hypothetical protein
MNISKPSTGRLVRTAVAGAITAGLGLAGLLGAGGAAHASTHPDGWAVIMNCTGVSGSVSYSPGLITGTARKETAALNGTTSGCSDIYSGAFSGTGTIFASLSGKSSVKSENWTGTFTIDWPASSSFNPSNGNLTVTDSSGTEAVQGTVTSGAFVGSEINMSYVITGKTGKGTKAKPVTKQTYINSQPLNLSENIG